MTVVIKNVAHDSVPNIEALRLEINADTSVGAVCEGIRLTPDVVPDTTDELYMVFDQAPSDPDLDAVIAASPQTTVTPPSTLALAKNVYTELVSFAVEDGTAVAFEIHMCGAIGVAADLSPVNLEISGGVGRRTGEGAKASNLFVRGANSALRARVTTTSSTASVEIRANRTATLTIDPGSTFVRAVTKP